MKHIAGIEETEKSWHFAKPVYERDDLKSTQKRPENNTKTALGCEFVNTRWLKIVPPIRLSAKNVQHSDSTSAHLWERAEDPKNKLEEPFSVYL
jgi:hypothetical protein